MRHVTLPNRTLCFHSTTTLSSTCGPFAVVAVKLSSGTREGLGIGSEIVDIAASQKLLSDKGEVFDYAHSILNALRALARPVCRLFGETKASLVDSNDFFEDLPSSTLNLLVNSGHCEMGVHDFTCAILPTIKSLCVNSLVPTLLGLFVVDCDHEAVMLHGVHKRLDMFPLILNDLKNTVVFDCDRVTEHGVDRCECGLVGVEAQAMCSQRKRCNCLFRRDGDGVHRR